MYRQFNLQEGRIKVSKHNELADIKVVCSLVKWETTSETVTRAKENGEVIYTDIVVRKKQS